MTDDSPEYIDPFGQAERDLNLHIAKMLEHMEWEATLPEAEKSSRRLPKLVGGLFRAVELSATNNMPWVWLGQLERIIHHVEVVYGAAWIAEAKARRQEFLGLDEDTEEDTHNDSA